MISHRCFLSFCWKVLPSISPFNSVGKSFHFVWVRKKKLPLNEEDFASTVHLRENSSWRLVRRWLTLDRLGESDWFSLTGCLILDLSLLYCDHCRSSQLYMKEAWQQIFHGRCCETLPDQYSQTYTPWVVGRDPVTLTDILDHYNDDQIHQEST